MPSPLPNPTHLALHHAHFNLKGFKTWEGRDAQGFQFTLLHEGSPVAQVTEHGNGGCLRVEWLGVTAHGKPMPIEPTATPAQRKKATAQAAQTVKALAALTRVINDAPDIDVGHGIVVRPNEERVLGMLAEVADIRKLTKKKTVFVEGDKMFTVAMPYTAEVAAALAAKRPGAVVLNALSVYY